MRITYVQIEGYTKGTRVQYTDATGGTVSSFSFYVTNYSSGDKFVLALYSDSAGTPGAEYWSSGSSCTSPSGTDPGGTGWKTVSESSGTVCNSWNAGLTQNAYYWFVWQWNSVDNGPSYVSGGASGTGTYLAQTFGTLLSTWSGGTLSTENWSMYLTYSAPSTVTQPVKVTMSNSATPATVTVNGCSPNPSTFSSDGSAHDVAMNPSCSYTLSFSNSGNAQDGFSVGGSFSSTSASQTSCGSGTCSELDLTAYLQLQNTYQAATGNSVNWDSGISIIPTGTYLGTSSTSICTISPTGGSTTTASCTGWADYDTEVTFPTTVNVNLIAVDKSCSAYADTSATASCTLTGTAGNDLVIVQVAAQQDVSSLTVGGNNANQQNYYTGPGVLHYYVYYYYMTGSGSVPVSVTMGSPTFVALSAFDLTGTVSSGFFEDASGSGLWVSNPAGTTAVSQVIASGTSGRTELMLTGASYSACSAADESFGSFGSGQTDIVQGVGNGDWASLDANYKTGSASDTLSATLTSCSSSSANVDYYVYALGVLPATSGTTPGVRWEAEGTTTFQYTTGGNTPTVTYFKQFEVTMAANPTDEGSATVGVIAGNDLTEGYTLNSGYLYAQQFQQGPLAATLQSISFYATGTGTGEVSLYSDSGSTSPQTRLITQQGVTVTSDRVNSWITVTMTGPNQVSLTADTYYWIVFDMSNDAVFSFSGGGGQRGFCDSWTYGTSFPDSWPAPGCTPAYDAGYEAQVYWTASTADNYYNSGSTITTLATPTDDNAFSSWTGSGSGAYSGQDNPAAFTLSGVITETANFLPPITVTLQQSGVGSDAASPIVTIDGTSYTVSQVNSGQAVFSWGIGSRHAIAALSPVGGSTGVQYLYAGWSDSGDQSHTITVSSGTTTYTVTFSTQYYLTMQAGSGGSVTPDSGWQNAGTQVAIQGTPDSGYSFGSWTGSGSGSYTGPGSSQTITMSGPISEAASFTSAVTMTVNYLISGGGSPSAPTFNYVISGAQSSRTLTTSPASVSVDPSSSWSVTPNPLTGSGASERWKSNSTLSGSATTTPLTFTFYNQYNQTQSYSGTGIAFLYDQFTDGTTGGWAYGLPSGVLPDGIHGACTDGYYLTADSADGNPKPSAEVLGETGSGYNCFDGMWKQVSLFGYSGGALYLSFDYRSVTTYYGINVGNLNLYIYDTNTKSLLYSTRYYTDIVTDSGWRSFPQTDLSGQLSSSSSVFIVLENYDQWSSNWHNANHYDNIHLYTSGAMPPRAPTYTANAFGVTAPVNLTTTPTTYWYDSGSSWSVTNPISGSSNLERWYTSQTDTGTIASAQATVFVYQHQYYLSMSSSPPMGGAVTPASGWQSAGYSVTITAIAADGYTFTSWTGTGTGSYSGTSDPASVTMSAPITEATTFVSVCSSSNSQPTPPSGYPVAQWDDFVGNSLGSFWTPANTTDFGNSVSMSGGGCLVVYAAGENDLITSGYGVNNGNGQAPLVLSANPVTGDFVFQAKGAWDGQSYQYRGFGLIVFQSEHNFIVVEQDPEGRIDFFYTINGVSTEHVTPSVRLDPAYLEINRIGTSYWVYYSQDGSSWTQAGSIQQPLSNTKVGLYARGWKPTLVPLKAFFDWAVLFQPVQLVQMTVSYQVLGGGSGYSAPAFNYVQGGVPQQYTLTADATALSVDSGSQWSVTPNPLTGSSSDMEQWYSSQTLEGTATAATMVFAFSHQYYLQMNAGAGGNVTPDSGWSDSGTQVQIEATPTGSNAFSYWAGEGSWSYSGHDNPYMITLSGPVTETANFISSSASITIISNPTGSGYLKVDGEAIVTPRTYYWQPGTQHTVEAVSPVANATGTQYVFASWNDGGAQNHTITTPSADTFYTATFIKQYYLTMQASVGGSVSSVSGWQNAGSTVTISASPSGTNTFQGWTGTGTGSYSGMDNPAHVTMSSPITELASFSVQGNTVSVTIDSDPSNLYSAIMVDGNSYSTPATFTWTPGAQHTIAAITASGGTGIQYLFQSWSDSGDQSHTITAPTYPATYTAHFLTQYYLTMQHPTGGGVTPQSGGWYYSGASVKITATPSNGFQGWSGSGAGSYTGTDNPAQVTMNGPITEAASFSGSVVTITVNSNPPGDVFVKVDGMNITTPHPFTWAVGETHSLTAYSPVNVNGVQYVWEMWNNTIDTGNRDQSQEYTVPAVNQTVTATFTSTAAPVTVTIDSNPEGLGLIAVDGGTAITTPHTYTSWTAGSKHTIAAVSPLSCGSGCQYVFTGWSDHGGESHQITVPATATTYTANFKTQYYLTMQTGSGGTVSPGSGWYNSGAPVTIHANPNSESSFASWAGSGSGSYTGTAQSTQIMMNGAITESAAFVPRSEFLLTVSTSPPGLSAQPTCSPVACPSGTLYVQGGSSVTVTAYTVQDWQFVGWTVTDSVGRTIVQLNQTSVPFNMPQGDAVALAEYEFVGSAPGATSGGLSIPAFNPGLALLVALAVLGVGVLMELGRRSKRDQVTD